MSSSPAGSVFGSHRRRARQTSGCKEVASLKTKRGTRLTKRQIDALASEADRGYNLSKAARETVRPGRPSLESGISPRISYRVAENLYARAKAKSKAEGRTVSEIAREALERYVGE